MTNTSSSRGARARVPAQSNPPRAEATGWVGWIVFAGVMMITVGAWHAIEGFVALFKDTYYLVSNRGLVLSFDYTAWGWIQIVVGLLVAAVGAALFTGRTWARVAGVGVIALSLLTNFTFINAYPVWSVTMIAVDILVIYALVAHGREIEDV